MLFAVNVNSQVPTSYVCVKYGIGNTNSSSNSSVVYVAVVDSTMIDSIAGITQNSAVVHVKFFFGALSDTISITLSGLLKYSQYIYKASILTDTSATTVESSTKTFMTLQCGYIPTSGHVAKNPCTDSVWVKDIPTGSTVQWIKGTSNFSTQPCFLTTQSGNYFCIVTDPTGCTMTTSPIVVNITGLTATTSGDVAICKGASAELSVNTNATGEVLYKWTPATGLDDPNIANPVASPVATTTYTATVSSGTCSVTSGLKVTVNVNNTNVTLTSDEDSLCNNSVHPIPLHGFPAGGTYGGQWVSQNYFIPDTTFVGASDATYVVTNINGCVATATKTLWVISSPKGIKMYYLGKTFIIDGYFPYPIEIKINGVIFLTSDQSSTQASFDNIIVKEGDAVTIRSIIGGCFYIIPFHFGMGIEEMNPDSWLQPGAKIDIYSISGIKVKTVISTKELRSDCEMNEILGDLLLSNGLYFWHSISIKGRPVSGKTVIFRQ